VNIAEPTVILMMAAASTHAPSARSRPVSRLFTITCYSPPGVPSIRQEGGVVSKIPAGVGPQYPHVIVLVGATGDLARRKLLPGLLRLSSVRFIPGCRVIGVSLDNLAAEGFRSAARQAVDEFCTHPVTDSDWASFAHSLDYVPLSAGPEALKAAVERAERSFNGESRR